MDWIVYWYWFCYGGVGCWFGEKVCFVLWWSGGDGDLCVGCWGNFIGRCSVVLVWLNVWFVRWLCCSLGWGLVGCCCWNCWCCSVVLYWFDCGGWLCFGFVGWCLVGCVCWFGGCSLDLGFIVRRMVCVLCCLVMMVCCCRSGWLCCIRRLGCLCLDRFLGSFLVCCWIGLVCCWCVGLMGSSRCCWVWGCGVCCWLGCCCCVLLVWGSFSRFVWRGCCWCVCWGWVGCCSCCIDVFRCSWGWGSMVFWCCVYVIFLM